MFFGKAGAYPIGEPFWKSLPMTNALAYYKNLLLTGVKSFLALVTGGSLMKLFNPCYWIYR
jgi:hypothetical protein